MKTQQVKSWQVADSASLYGIDGWGQKNFSISSAGEVTVTIPFDTGDVAIPIVDIIQAARDRDHELPLLLRIENLLDARVSEINETFQQAIEHAGYKAEYRGVFPVKVNQQCSVIEEISRFGTDFGHGLEAGSKAELLLCLANLNDNGLLICNGSKDQNFIDLGLWANRLGHQCFFVIESPSELPLIIARSQKLGIKPLIGLRIKISSKVGGLWTETSGDRSSFGLSTAQLIATVDQLRQAKMLDCLQLLHCHLGSQIPDIEEIKVAVREAARFYADLATENVPLKYLDLGGGLAVDYIGNQSLHSHSPNYNLADYCRCLVETIKETLAPHNIDHPTIVTESGRATVAHTSILLFEILNVVRYEANDLPEDCPEHCHPLVTRQYQLYQQAEVISPSEGYVEALTNRDKIRELFRSGVINLRERAMAENLFLAIAQTIAKKLDQLEKIPLPLDSLKQSLADIYYGNFSVFQSLPDTWAIGQMFPVMPVHRLNECPDRNATISDLTCDCDGKLDRFVLAGGESKTLPLHSLKAEEDYILGAFLMGAYQETMGDLHNLFGYTNVISIRINKEGGFDVTKEQSGDTISEVLSILEYNPTLFYKGFRDKVELAVKKKKINVKERQQILNHFSAQLNGQTYFNV
ncbi:arginine decarboxylase [Desulfuromusa kysingii]|uniref:Arginine decarboxylase n=1 Tax=Desulfuromusa kysingii TaxID=37625 RepID=A0A1H3WBA6_9BACT|nr:biosynthetic arginine decarboxylase [Desulfuromusa kysingii]SDZ83704.1 arginine decarboxylase [Desulfuromusa kysingii]